MTSFKKRLEVLEAALKDQMAAKRMHDPFIQLKPWSMIEDQYQVIYYPEGMYRPPEKSSLMCFADACAVLAMYPGNLYCQISMGSCLEWLFVFYQFGIGSDMYTQDQLDRFIKKDLEHHPQISFLLKTEVGKSLAETMLRLPQTYAVQLSNLQRALREFGGA